MLERFCFGPTQPARMAAARSLPLVISTSTYHRAGCPDPSHPVYALRPADPLEVVPTSCFYAPRDSFVYPGGEEDLGLAEGHP